MKKVVRKRLRRNPAVSFFVTQSQTAQPEYVSRLVV